MPVGWRLPPGKHSMRITQTMLSPFPGSAIRGVVMRSLLLTLLTLVGVESASAIPAWARKYESTCALCHSACPSLNSMGRFS